MTMNRQENSFSSKDKCGKKTYSSGKVDGIQGDNMDILKRLIKTKHIGQDGFNGMRVGRRSSNLKLLW